MDIWISEANKTYPEIDSTFPHKYPSETADSSWVDCSFELSDNCIQYGNLMCSSTIR